MFPPDQTCSAGWAPSLPQAPFPALQTPSMRTVVSVPKRGGGKEKGLFKEYGGEAKKSLDPTMMSPTPTRLFPRTLFRAFHTHQDRGTKCGVQGSPQAPTQEP